ncbi:hypothetical protein P7D52_13360 [Enterococcus dongliensis]|uniref:Phage protein n=1 Tax=Enterococcus dongliensis TaxID=2559925 RepID=A0AAW8TKI0_9ENTE|nr:hypothetical protein [Enterococcus dongliensis]NBK09575.1 hypothetical protein [Enterococcus asini]MDT2597112.1 hypothetical protein [Enterococcus dongliensis]MDT2635089.1 hypothetical protein [Enterococcus dongliensis]MDT2636228.1 hypothetical protein [Enterococcus dongliensis]MDT2643763.1 hypothetical protein [Enterococcus dongliensis]
MSIEFSGFDDIKNRLDKMSKAAQELDGEQEVPMSELLTDPFISKNSNFQNVDEFFENSGFDMNTEEEFAAIPDDAMDTYVAENSTFESWNDMLSSATQEYVAKKLGL